MRTSGQSRYVAGAIVLAFGAAGCSPYVMSYKHLNFEKKVGLEVLERSTTSPDTQGAELHSPRFGMPLKLRLTRPAYTLHFDTPMQTSPVVFLSARDKQGVALVVTGPNVQRVSPGSAAELDGFEYSFYVREAKGDPLSVTISDSTGKVLGAETLPYKIVSRGYSYGVDSV